VLTQVSWDSAYRSVGDLTGKGDSSGRSMTASEGCQEGQQLQELRKELAAAQAAGVQEFAELDLQPAEATASSPQASIPGRNCSQHKILASFRRPRSPVAVRFRFGGPSCQSLTAHAVAMQSLEGCRR